MGLSKRFLTHRRMDASGKAVKNWGQAAWELFAVNFLAEPAEN